MKYENRKKSMVLELTVEEEVAIIMGHQNHQRLINALKRRNPEKRAEINYYYARQLHPKQFQGSESDTAHRLRKAAYIESIKNREQPYVY